MFVGMSCIMGFSSVATRVWGLSSRAQGSLGFTALGLLAEEVPQG